MIELDQPRTVSNRENGGPRAAATNLRGGQRSYLDSDQPSGCGALTLPFDPTNRSPTARVDLAQGAQALNAAEVTSAFYDLKLSFRGITNGVVQVVEDFKDQWSRNTEALGKGAQNFDVKISFETPPQALRALKEIEKIKKRPGLL